MKDDNNIHPGVMPTLSSPKKGDSIQFRVEGLPPIKNRSFSIRNTRSKDYEKFKSLRIKATEQMKKRRWYDGPITLNITVYIKDQKPQASLNDYMSGIMDTLDGSHGFTFTYLPVVYQDDCQVNAGHMSFGHSEKDYYEVEVIFG
jgi:hypothetical protein